MTEEQTKMTRYITAEIIAAAVEIVILEVILACFNSYEYQDAGEIISACFETDELKTVHKYFEKHYNDFLCTFLSLDEQEQNRILNEYIEYKSKELKRIDKNKPGWI